MLQILLFQVFVASGQIASNYIKCRKQNEPKIWLFSRNRGHLCSIIFVSSNVLRWMKSNHRNSSYWRNSDSLFNQLNHYLNQNAMFIMWYHRILSVHVVTTAHERQSKANVPVFTLTRPQSIFSLLMLLRSPHPLKYCRKASCQTVVLGLCNKKLATQFFSQNRFSRTTKSRHLVLSVRMEQFSQNNQGVN